MNLNGLLRLFPLGLLLFAFPGFSQSLSGGYTFRVDDQLEERIYAINQLEFIEDETNELAFEDILQPKYQQKFKVNPDFSKNQFSTGHTYWVKVSIAKSTSSSRKWLMEFYDQTIDEITAFVPRLDGTYQIQRTGDRSDFGQRTFSHKNFEILVDNNETGVDNYYFKIRSSQKADIRIAFRSFNRFVYYALNEYFLYGVFYGMILIIALYNQLMYLAIREVKYLYYVFYLVSVGIYAMCIDGIAFQYLWPRHPEWNQIASGLFSYLIVVFATLFSLTFLHLRVRMPWMDKLLKGIIWVKTLVFGIGIIAVPSLLEIKLYDIIPFFLVLLSSIYVLSRGYRVARLFVIAYAVLLLGIVLKIMVHTALIPHSTVLYYSLHIAFLLEMLLLTLALGDRVKILKENRDQALRRSLKQAEANAMLKEKVNRELEMKVRERTQELADKNALLEQYNQQILEKDQEIKRINSLLDKDIWKLKTQIRENLQARVTNKRMTYVDFQKIFPDSSTCYRYLEELKWGEGFTCKSCDHTKHSEGPKLFTKRCSRCGHIESVTAGTVFHGIKFPLEKAFYIAYTVISETEKLTLDQLSALLDLRRNTISAFRVKVKNLLELNGAHQPEWENIILEKHTTFLN